MAERPEPHRHVTFGEPPHVVDFTRCRLVTYVGVIFDGDRPTWTCTHVLDNHLPHKTVESANSCAMRHIIAMCSPTQKVAPHLDPGPSIPAGWAVGHAGVFASEPVFDEDANDRYRRLT